MEDGDCMDIPSIPRRRGEGLVVERARGAVELVAHRPLLLRRLTAADCTGRRITAPEKVALAMIKESVGGWKKVR